MTSRDQSLSPRFLSLLLACALLCSLGAVLFAFAAVPTAHAQAVLPSPGVVKQNANQRSGPGTNYPIVGKAKAGTAVVVVETNPAGDWYHLDNGNWIAAFLVTLGAQAGATEVWTVAPGQPAGIFTTVVTTTVVTTTVGSAPLNPTVAPVPLFTGIIPSGAQTATVVAVTGGDTIEVLANGVTETVRYLGIAAPAMGQPGAAQSTAANRSRVEGQAVYLVPDQTDRDALNRLLRYVFLPDGAFVNAQQLADGWVQPALAVPDTGQVAAFERLALDAAKARRGFWGGSFTGSDLAAYALTTTRAPLFSGPGANNGVDALLPLDTPLTALGRSQDGAWVRVRTPRGDEGWVFVPHLVLNVPISTLVSLSDVPSGATPVPSSAQAVPGAVVVATPLPGQVPGVVVPTPNVPTVLIESNVYGGPGTAYPVAGTVLTGTVLFLTGRNEESTWYQTSTATWIAGERIAGVQPGLPVVTVPPPPTPTATPLSTPVLVVPPGVTAPTPTFTPTPTITPLPPGALPPTATPLPPQPLVRIIALDRANEWVILYNDGAGAQDLTGWALLSEAGTQSCPLLGTLEPRASLRVWAQVGPDGLSCGFPEPIWENAGADDAILVNAKGEYVSRYQ